MQQRVLQSPWSVLMFCVSFLIVISLIINPIKGVELHPRDATHRGVVDEGGFTFFPENRLGNGLYREGKLLASKTGRSIISAKLIRGTNSVVYLYTALSDELGLGLVNGMEDGTGRLKRVDTEFYEYSNQEIGYQRIFRVLNRQIIAVLDNLRTGTGVTLSDTHAVFYHIVDSSSIMVEGDSGEQVSVWNYKFRLHLARRGKPGVVNLYQFTIEDQSLRLNLF